MNKNKIKMLVAAILALVLSLSLCTAAFAKDSNSSHITATGSYENTAATGQLLQIELKDIFSDSNGDTLKFELTQTYDEHYIKLTGSTLYITQSETGTVNVPIKASCSSDELIYTLTFTIEPAQDGDASQYGYDESAQSSVKVYFTLSSDGVPIRGNEDDETVLSHLEVEVPYFDLGLYGLEDYYRYTTDESSSYVGDKAIERPTALHLYIYMIERYYMGLPEDQCCKGTSGVLSYTGSGDGVYNMYGDIAYEDSLSALNITGSATSMYMQNFWGHDENLMYYRNHVYPLQRAGWGSTADYILLSDNDTIDVAMFTNWSFYNYGAFACFGDGNTTTPINSTTAAVGETLTLQTLKYDTKSSVQGGNEGFETISDLALEVYNEDWECISKAAPDEDGKYEVKFSKAGKYHVIAIDPNCGGEDACYAPATVEVTVSDASKEPIMGDLNNDGTVDKNDCLILNSIVNNKTTATEYQESVADVNGDGEINTRDVVRLVSYVNGKITSL